MKIDPASQSNCSFQGSRVPGFRSAFQGRQKTAQHSKDPETETQTVTAVGQKYDLHVLYISKHPWDYNDISLESTRLVAAGLSLWLVILQAPIPPESIRDFHIFRTFHMRCFWYLWYQDGISDRQKIPDLSFHCKATFLESWGQVHWGLWNRLDPCRITGAKLDRNGHHKITAELLLVWIYCCGIMKSLE